MIAIKAPKTSLESADLLFKACADPTRLRILNLLSPGELCVCDVVKALDMPQPKVSRHLAYLRRAELVENRKKGLWVYYRLADATSELHQSLIDCLGCCLGKIPMLAADLERLGRKPVCCVKPLEGAAP
jgi:ArsR family transcriptional regulator